MTRSILEVSGTAPAAVFEPAPLGPTAQGRRIASLDVLRGVAVLGILVMNIQSFSMPIAAYMNPTAYGDFEGANYRVWFFSHLLADQKFMTIFSLLFGAGIALMADRVKESGRAAGWVHYRRMAWLLLFGLAHAHLLWYGDILYTYAICGMLVYPLRRLPIPVLLLAGFFLLLIPSGFYIASGFALQAPAEMREQSSMGWFPTPEKVQEEVEAYQGSWREQMPHRVPTAVMFETLLVLIWALWRAGGLMLIGIALYRLGVLSATRSRGFYLAMIVVGGAVGLTLSSYGIGYVHAQEWRFPESMFFGSQFNYWGSLATSAAWMGVVVLLCKMKPDSPLLRPFAAVGQMALTNYLLHTLICTTIFYGHGFGQFGEFSRVEQILTVGAIWIFQLIASPIWLRFFRFGPFEWLWRSLTYLRLQPLRR